MTHVLLVLRCGRNSLHSHWLSSQKRNWDLVLCPYEEIDARDGAAAVIPGQKWEGLTRFFRGFDAWRDYDYICLPDDDISTDTSTLNAFFNLCIDREIHLAAPALTPNSYFSHMITMKNTEFVMRRSTFVEIMMPCFSRSFFERVLPTFELSVTGTGFGLDFLWPYMLGYKDTWIMDATAVHHTRPGGRRSSLMTELAKADLDFIRYLGVPGVLKTLAGIDSDLALRRCGDPEFQERYTRGYSYLADRVSNWSQNLDDDLFVTAPVTAEATEKKIAFAIKHLVSGDRPVSRGRPCRVSSVSQWSWSQDPTIEARGANDGRINGCGGFHTDRESNPWWEVDLANPHYVEKVAIYNRLDQQSRCVNFDILLSDDAVTWCVAYAKRDGKLFGGADGNPFLHVFVSPPIGRFIRIQLVDANWLHLDQVEVFGSPVHEPDTTKLAPPTQRAPSVITELVAELYGSAAPLDFCDLEKTDDGYPHTNIVSDIIDSVLDILRPTFWLEIGSMLGGSAVRTADRIKSHGLDTEIVCIDPFCGDVNMWAWEQPKRRTGEWLFLKLENGRPTIFDRFIANVVMAGHKDIILPIMTTSIIGIKLLGRLKTEGRITSLPDVIYLDSAHNPDETFLELKQCWELLRPGGILMGDDWSWDAVRGDVLRFRRTVALDDERRRLLADRHKKFSDEGGVLLDRGQWLLTKPVQ